MQQNKFQWSPKYSDNDADDDNYDYGNNQFICLSQYNKMRKWKLLSDWDESVDQLNIKLVNSKDNVCW